MKKEKTKHRRPRDAYRFEGDDCVRAEILWRMDSQIMSLDLESIEEEVNVRIEKAIHH